MSISEGLGTLKEVKLPQGTVRYREQGSGETLLFIHGLLVNGDLWRKVVPVLTENYRCITPDLPLGSHTLPMNAHAEVTPAGVARLISDFMTALELTDVTLVGNDTGGALCQLVITHHPQRIKRLVLTNCDAYEVFPPLSLRGFQLLPRIPGGIWGFAQLLRLNFVQKLLVALLAKTQPETGVRQSYFQPAVRQPEIRRDLHNFMLTISNRYTKDAALQFSQFHKPVLLVWGRNDPFFSVRLAERLKKDFPDARLYYLDGARAFVPEDQPLQLAQHLESFMKATTPVSR